jgi:glycosyltransferase involved in cell wall biosynthesis
VLTRLVREARRSSVVVSGTEVGPSLLLAWLAARLTRRPLAVLVQASLSGALAEWVPPRLHPLTRWVHTHADLAVCVSPGLVDEVRRAGVPEERIAVVAVGIDVTATREAAVEPVPPVTDRPYLVAVGRLVPQKGFDVLVEAYALAAGRLSTHDLVVVGEGPERAALQALRDRHGLTGSVHLPGFLPNPQPVLAGADLFVLPSRYEGMGGLVLLEAMAHGIPIVATDCVSGPRDLLDDGRIGRLVPVEDVAALAEALCDHIADPARLRAAAAAGPERARNFAPDRWVTALRDALEPLRADRR